jgi:hypothetical protein
LLFFPSYDYIFLFITGPEVEGKYSADLFVQRARQGFMTRMIIIIFGLYFVLFYIRVYDITIKENGNVR